MNRILKRIFDMLHAIAHKRKWVSNLDRPLTPDSDMFESYIDYSNHNYHHAGTFWMKRTTQKFPLDAWIYQEILAEIEPDVIVEIGNFQGGGTLFLANMLDLIHKGRIIAIDIDQSKIDFTHPRITWITGDANSPDVLMKVKSRVKPDEKVIVIEDSSHTYENTLSVLRNYAKLVSVGSYFIVEDGIIRYPFVEGPKPGPYEATHQFLAENSDFAIDKKREKFRLTYNPDGYLLRVK